MTRASVRAAAVAMALLLGVVVGAPEARAQTREEIWHALLGVYFHTTPVEDRPAQVPIRLPSLEDAARRLATNQGPGASALRRRAAVRIGAAALRPGAAPGEGRAELEALGLPPGFLDAILAKLGGGRDRLCEAALEQAIQTSLNQLEGTLEASFERTCCSGLEFCKIDRAHSESQGTAGYFQLRVERSVDGANGLKDAMDPQDWDGCVPSQFQAVHRTGDACPLTKEPVPPESSKPAGSDWQGAVFEHFVVDPNGPTWFRNYLRVDWSHDATAREYCFEYDLCTPFGSIDSEVLGDERDGGIEVDKGFVRAAPLPSSPNTSVLTGLKIVRFTPSAVELWKWANFTMAPAIDLIVNVGVCCGATSDSGTCELEEESCVQAEDPMRDLPASATCN